MELFTLGVGNYTEKDVREAARAFTGWHTSGGRFTFVQRRARRGPKTVLGQTGDWDGDDVVRILLEQPACARFLVRKLYQFLVSENATPPDALPRPARRRVPQERLRHRGAGADDPAVAALLLGPRLPQRVKWPVEYAVGVVRMIGVGVTGRITVNPYSLLGVMELMGQQLYAPPNVKGWEAGRAWLNTATVLARHNFAHSLVNGWAT